jgi:hypothetical protein
MPKLFAFISSLLCSLICVSSEIIVLYEVIYVHFYFKSKIANDAEIIISINFVSI